MTSNILSFSNTTSADGTFSLFSTLKFAFHDYWQEHQDPRTKHMFLVGDSTSLLTGVGLWFIFVLYAGPLFMRNRLAYTLRIPILLYNTFMIIANFSLFIYILGHVDYGRRFFKVQPDDITDTRPEVLEELRMAYFCYLTRIMDLLDTIFFVFRKKQSQITFLHVYHHTSVPILGHLAMKVAPQAPVIGLFLMFNTFIHSIMYLYYALASFGPNFRKYLWWKRYITQLQMIQFITCGFFCLFLAFKGANQMPTGLFWIGFSQNPFFFYMFYQFYRKNYQVKSKKV